MPDSSSSLKLAIVGCGAISRFHLDGIRDSGVAIDIAAAVDADIGRAEQLASETGATAFASLEEALDRGDFDSVDLLLPHDLHETAAVQCLEAGKHVLLEKPMAPTLEACERILAAAEEAGTVFMVAENAQYWPEIVKARELIREGVIGEVITARAGFICEFDDYWFKGKRPWRNDRARTGGGIAIDGGSHWIRPLRMWLGEISEVVAALDYPLEDMEGESLVRALFRFESGVIAGFDAMMIDAAMAPDPWWRITGSAGEITIDGGFDGGIRVYDNAHRDGLQVMEPEGYAKSFGPELADFAGAVLEGRQLQAGPREALGELRTVLAIYRSAASGAWEKVFE